MIVCGLHERLAFAERDEQPNPEPEGRREVEKVVPDDQVKGQSSTEGSRRSIEAAITRFVLNSFSKFLTQI